jgi:hypothetical protein
MAHKMDLKDKELAAQLVTMQIQYDLSKDEAEVSSRHILNNLVLEQKTAALTARQESEVCIFIYRYICIYINICIYICKYMHVITHNSAALFVVIYLSKHHHNDRRN